MVVPEHRRHGLATNLIKWASEMAKELGVGVLYFLTDVPALYTALGWMGVHADGSSSVSKKPWTNCVGSLAGGGFQFGY